MWSSENTRGGGGGGVEVVMEHSAYNMNAQYTQVINNTRSSVAIDKLPQEENLTFKKHSLSNLWYVTWQRLSIGLPLAQFWAPALRKSVVIEYLTGKMLAA